MRRLTILLLSLALLLALPGCSAREQSIYEQDYDYLWYLLENEYPHYYVAERLRDRDLDEIKAQYAALLPEVETTQEFYELIIAPCLSDTATLGIWACCITTNTSSACTTPRITPSPMTHSLMTHSQRLP